MRTLPWLLLPLLTLVTGCPKPPQPQVAVPAPASQPVAASPTAPPARLVHFKLTPGATQAKPFTVGGAKHEVTAELIRLEVLDDPAELDDEGLHPKTLADLKTEAQGSFMICEIEVKVDGKPLSDPSVKGTFTSVGTEFSYGGEVYYSGYHYVGPAKGRPDVLFHVRALKAVRGDGDWGLKQLLYLADQTKIELEFSGSVKLPDAG